MNKLFLVFGLIILSATACQKKSVLIFPESEKFEQIRPTCGMDEAMSGITIEMRNAIKKNAEAANSQASEILLFLDFDGAVVSQGFPNPSGNRSSLINGVRTCPAPALTDEQKNVIIKLVEDDFSPFSIIITTDQAVFNNYPSINKELCIITTLPSVIGFGSGVGGVSPFAGLGFRIPFDPSFVFAQLYGTDLAEIASTISHEVGHTMGLGHQSHYNSSCGFMSEYHPGFGSGLLGFGPIMGIGGKRISNWFAQPCLVPGYGIPQNDFAFLNEQVELRLDDFPDFQTGNINNANEINGILEQSGDVDFIRINFRKPGPVTITSENIDIKISLYNLGGQLMGVYEDPNDTHVTIPFANGIRFLKIEAVSNVNMPLEFMTGQYKIIY